MAYWLTPPNIYEDLNREFGFDFDPCPFPRPENYNGLDVDWGNVNYVNPPFRTKDSYKGLGPTAFVRKAIQEKEKGNSSVILIPTQSYVNLLLDAGAELRSMGRVRWLDTETKEPWKSPVAITAFVLRGKSRS